MLRSSLIDLSCMCKGAFSRIDVGSFTTLSCSLNTLPFNQKLPLMCIVWFYAASYVPTSCAYFCCQTCSVKASLSFSFSQNLLVRIIPQMSIGFITVCPQTLYQGHNHDNIFHLVLLYITYFVITSFMQKWLFAIAFFSSSVNLAIILQLLVVNFSEILNWFSFIISYVVILAFKVIFPLSYSVVISWFWNVVLLLSSLSRNFTI